MRLPQRFGGRDRSDVDRSEIKSKHGLVRELDLARDRIERIRSINNQSNAALLTQFYQIDPCFFGTIQTGQDTGQHSREYDVIKCRNECQVDLPYRIKSPPFQNLQMSLTGANQDQLPRTNRRGDTLMGRSWRPTFENILRRIPAGRSASGSIRAVDNMFSELGGIQVDIGKRDLIQISVNQYRIRQRTIRSGPVISRRLVRIIKGVDRICQSSPLSVNRSSTTGASRFLMANWGRDTEILDCQQ